MFQNYVYNKVCNKVFNKRCNSPNRGLKMTSCMIKEVFLHVNPVFSRTLFVDRCVSWSRTVAMNNIHTDEIPSKSKC